jgi:cytochrome c biogenesis protein
MRTALILLLLLAAAAIPGSIYPQRSADPNGVTAFFKGDPQLAKFLDALQLFDVYSSSWFSAIYILLFVSLIGCVVPRTGVHYRALRSAPVATPTRLQRFPGYRKAASVSSAKHVLETAQKSLRDRGYRVELRKDSVSAEKGYLRETGNLVFHIALIGVLIAAGFGGGLAYSGQRVLVEGETFVNNLSSYDSFSPGVFFDESQLKPFAMTLNKFEAIFDLKNPTNIGTPLDFRASVSTRLAPGAEASKSVIRVNEPLQAPGANVYLTGNGYAPVVTFTDPDGQIAFQGAVEFLPQDSNYTSLGVIKLPDANPQEFGVLAFFYPTKDQLATGAFTSKFPGLVDPLLSMNLYVGNLGLNDGTPQNVFSLKLHGLKQVAGGKSGTEAIKLEVGQTKTLPGNLGTVTFDGIKRFASLDVAYNPAELYVLAFSLLGLAALAVSLSVPRRRVWVRKFEGGFEVAALARNDDPHLQPLVDDLVQQIAPTKSSRKAKK